MIKFRVHRSGLGFFVREFRGQGFGGSALEVSFETKRVSIK